MKRNYALLRQVYNIIETEPHRHDQRYWGRRTQCGTTMCVAGHASVLAGAVPIWIHEAGDAPGEVYFAEVRAHAEDDPVSIFCHAAHVLGLNVEEADELFLDTETRGDVLLLLKGYLNEQGGEGDGGNVLRPHGDDGGDT